MVTLTDFQKAIPTVTQTDSYLAMLTVKLTVIGLAKR
jgi:hypothetical protein